MSLDLVEGLGLLGAAAVVARVVAGEVKRKEHGDVVKRLDRQERMLGTTVRALAMTQPNFGHFFKKYEPAIYRELVLEVDPGDAHDGT